MRRITLGLVILTGAATLGATGAFFSDTETSVGNSFVAGAIDLQVDNTSYYNGVLSPGTSWTLRDLTVEKFFNFTDIKPGDFGEDTISLHVETNDAYVCANVTLTSNDDNGLTEPESEVDTTGGNGEGELAASVNFVWWADDGDNVLEDDEEPISQGPIFVWWADDGDNVLEDDEEPISQGPIGVLTTGPIAFALADSSQNIWTGAPGPILGSETYYIGKAWCFGDLSTAPLTQDALGADSPRTPANSTGGISCDAGTLGNETQTDSLTADVTFEAIQARHNDNFLCEVLIPPPPPPPAPPPPPLTENFGEGECLPDIPGWDEDAGESCVNGTVAKNADTGDDTVSPDGGRFGLLSGNNGFICRSVNAAGLENLVLAYYWRGDAGANDGETGSVHYFTSGSCAAPGTLTTLASHELDDGNNNVPEPWSALQSINLPGVLDNTTFFIRFTADSNSGNESFRVDGISITGTAI